MRTSQTASIQLLILRFSDGESDTVEGVVLRASENELVANLKRGVSLKRLMSEQIRMWQKYPTTLASPDEASGEAKS